MIFYFLREGHTNGCLGTTFEILYFVVKKRITVWLQQQHFVFLCKKTDGRLGTGIKRVITSNKINRSYVNLVICLN